MSAYERVTWGSGGYLPTTSPLRLHVLRDGTESDRLNQSSRRYPRTYRNSHTFFKKQIFQNIYFWALSRGPWGSRPHFLDSLIAPRTLGFSRLSTSSLTKDFTQALPTSYDTYTSTPYSDSPPRVTYPTFFSRLSTSIITKRFTQALPPTTSPLHYIQIPLLALRTLRSFPTYLPPS